MESEVDELVMKYVVSHYRNLMTEDEINGLSATSYKNGAGDSSGDRAVVRQAIYDRLMREHSDEITIPRCKSCGRVVQQSWKKHCPQCRHNTRSSD
jgi:rubrerythrin